MERERERETAEKCRIGFGGGNMQILMILIGPHTGEVGGALLGAIGYCYKDCPPCEPHFLQRFLSFLSFFLA